MTKGDHRIRRSGRFNSRRGKQIALVAMDEATSPVRDVLDRRGDGAADDMTSFPIKDNCRPIKDNGRHHQDTG
ncbi:hypothetical protein [Brevundimonas diminuta]|uniref:hypothetical protein n=1 Tax=Brevundimonas diminuta TaxID=293 RepID=UPI003D9A76C5